MPKFDCSVSFARQYIYSVKCTFDPLHEISNNVVCATSAYAQSDQRLCKSLKYSMTVKLLTDQHLEFLSLKGGGTGSSEYLHVKMPHCWKSRVAARLYLQQQDG